jgi:catechol 2,3-dioxygenase-like lactoylglutathione lyase family enzyme
LVVRDYDEAIDFYTRKLHFTLVEDTPLSETKRWVLVAPPGSEGCRLLLAKASGEEQLSRIGNQTGGRVFLFLHTDDFERDYQNLLEQNIRIVRTPVKEAYGTVAVFEDLYGNLWDLIQL